MKVLVVEDEDFLRDIIGRQLSLKGFEVDLAENAEEAKKSIQENEYHHIVSDVQMPGESGVDLYRWVREELGSKVNFVFMTGYSHESLDDKMGEKTQVIAKPFSNQDLFAMLGA